MWQSIIYFPISLIDIDSNSVSFKSVLMGIWKTNTVIFSYPCLEWAIDHPKGKRQMILCGAKKRKMRTIWFVFLLVNITQKRRLFVPQIVARLRAVRLEQQQMAQDSNGPGIRRNCIDFIYVSLGWLILKWCFHVVVLQLRKRSNGDLKDKYRNIQLALARGGDRVNKREKTGDTLWTEEEKQA